MNQVPRPVFSSKPFQCHGLRPILQTRADGGVVGVRLRPREVGRRGRR